MPTYHFDVFDGEKTLVDEVGDAFPDAGEAAEQAAALLADIAAEAVPRRCAQDFAVAVKGEDGQDVYRAALIFRDWHPDPSRPEAWRDVSQPLSVPNPVDLIRRSQDTRAASRSIASRASDAASGLSDLFRQAQEAMAQVRGAVAALR